MKHGNTSQNRLLYYEFQPSDSHVFACTSSAVNIVTILADSFLAVPGIRKAEQLRVAADITCTIPHIQLELHMSNSPVFIIQIRITYYQGKGLSMSTANGIFHIKGVESPGVLIPCSCPQEVLLAGPDPQQTSSKSHHCPQMHKKFDGHAHSVE